MPPRSPAVDTALSALIREIEACTICAGQLPLGPRPVVSLGAEARVLIIGQAPGTRVHASGVPWDDASGARLRMWMQIDAARFYDANRIAIMPMGFCYPGRGRSGDLPPRPECAPQWHERILARLPNIRLTLLIGQYAQARYLQDGSRKLEDNVRDYARHLRAGLLPLPHPSPRNSLWIRRRPWFEEDVIPALRAALSAALAQP